LTIEDAKAFAQWAGKRLPTRLEWVKAARDSGMSSYPWGNEPDPARANVKNNPGGKGAVVSVNSFPEADTRSGLRQMAGNVWELVDELRRPSATAVKIFRSELSPPPREDEPWYVMMGGSAGEPLIQNAAFNWASVPARFSSAYIGFRCVMDLPGR
jgi:formylglycine-generating enzyme required for sulfatase activity